jgi:hypothetical protein
MCTSLIEEAEAINWYAQRLAIERDSAAAAIMRDAQNEEFKHFSMDLEYLLRRSPRWRTVAQRILFQAGDILEHGEEGEEAVDAGNEDESNPPSRRAAPPRPAGDAASRLARHRRPEGARSDEPPAARARADHRRGWEELEEEARQHLAVHLAARKLVDFSGPARLGALGTNLGRTEPLSPTPVDGVDARRRRCCRSSRRARGSACRAPSSTRRQGRRRRRPRPARRRRRRIALGREHRGLPGAGRGVDDGHRAASPYDGSR